MKQEISDLTLLERVQRLEKQTGIRSSLILLVINYHKE